jgi:hypothetical protein
MDTYSLQRNRNAGTLATWGQLFDPDGEQVCVTLEPPVPFPAGTYKCVPHSGPRFKNVWEITGIAGHDAVLFHNGNTPKDTKLCVLVGSTYGHIDGVPAVLHSKDTLDDMRDDMPDEFMLEVKDYEVS